jgi:hypothetical protein
LSVRNILEILALLVLVTKLSAFFLTMLFSLLSFSLLHCPPWGSFLLLWGLIY